MPPTAAELTEEAQLLFAPEPPTEVRVAILNATGKPSGANKVAVLLSEYKRRDIEDRIGMQLEVVNLSSAEAVRPGRSILFYRPEFLRAALAMARAIPGEQLVEPMRPAALKRAGVDVEIVVGAELP
ncbi:MAG: LytR C-terminal domain-containing protein [SAR324 cluster bacterium]